MMKIVPSKLAIAGVVMAAIYAAPANAQTRTWVSGVGDDLNPCSRTAPCKTFAGAISKTAANGKINCLDPGGFGAVTITKSMEIDCLQFPGGILNAGTNGVNVVVASNVMIDRCFIAAQTGNGVIVNLPSGLAQVMITDTNIMQVARGVLLTTTGAGASVGEINNTGIFTATTSGVELSGANTFASIDRSTIMAANNAVTTSAGAGKATVSNSTLYSNAVGIKTVGAGSLIRINNNSIVDNANSISIGAGTTVSSSGTNRVDPVGTSPNGTFVAQ